MGSPLSITEELLDTYIRYLNTPFRLRSPGLSEEREAMLRQPGIIFQKPLVELLPGYRLTESDVGRAEAELRLAAGFADFVRAGLFFTDPTRQLFDHQIRALDLATRPIGA